MPRPPYIVRVGRITFHEWEGVLTSRFRTKTWHKARVVFETFGAPYTWLFVGGVSSLDAIWW